MTFLAPHQLDLRHECLLPMLDRPVYDTELYLLVALLLYAWLLYRMSARLIPYFRFLFDWRALDKVVPGRRGKTREAFYFFCVISVSLLTVGLYLYQWAVHPDMALRYIHRLPAWVQASEREVLLRLFVWVAAAYGIKWLLLYGSSKLFREAAFGQTAIRLETGYLMFWVLWALPELLVSFALPGAIPVVLIGLGILYLFILLFRWFKLLVLSRQLSQFSYLHIFLYLCALEILPFLCLYKLLDIVIA